MEPASLAAMNQAPSIMRRFTHPEQDVWDQFEWNIRDAKAGDFVQKDVEAPTIWSDQAVGVVAKLYFATVDGVREHSVRQLVERVALKIAIEGLKFGYFGKEAKEDDSGNVHWDFPPETNETYRNFCIFRDELMFILLNQMAAFNTPVNLNFGVPGRDQVASACFLLSISDTMTGENGITSWWNKEALIFKGGAGSGINVSNLRGSMEALSTGGLASGPCAYMRTADSGAGTLKSGGAHRRAAKMVCMDVDHPDIQDFIWLKPREDERMRALIAAGFDLNPMTAEGEKLIAECTTCQNANFSVRVSDEFMQAVENDLGWDLIGRKTGEVVKTVEARVLMKEISDAAWACADPGILFHDTINAWHTTPHKGPITTCNPCLVGDTLVDTSEGRIPIEELVAMYAEGKALPMAFAWDTEERVPKLKQIRKAWMTKMATRLVEVKTEKGVTIRCTPDHPILVRDNLRSRAGEESYVPAEDLKAGDRLRKIGRWSNDQRSGRNYINHRATDESPKGTTYQPRWMWEQVYGPIPDEMQVHHINEESSDDRLSNFELRDAGIHQSFHSTGSRNGRYYDCSDELLVETWEAVEQVGRFGVTKGAWDKYIRDNDLGGTIPIQVHGRIRGMTWEKFEEWIAEHRSLTNDIVVSVEVIDLDAAVPVYDVTVDGTHNLAVGDQEHTIIVHNCAETHLNDDSSCNLAHLNIMKFLSEDGKEFKVTEFTHVVDVITTAMDITCSFSDLPTEEIERNTRNLRQLGIGYANLGAAIMVQGMAYDSPEGRDFASSVTALLTGRCYVRSGQLAKQLGQFEEWPQNCDAMMHVLERHESEIARVARRHSDIWAAARTEWNETLLMAAEGGLRNAQASVIAPTGTTSFMMGCDTTGAEPSISLVSYKGLAAGGSMKMVNESVERSLQFLEYSNDQVADIVTHLRLHGQLVGVRAEHMPIFATALGDNPISPKGHIEMLAAIQPFISGAISKTVNVVEATTAEEIKEFYSESYRLGVKAVAIYREGSKTTSVVTVKPTGEIKSQPISKAAIDLPPKMLDKILITHGFSIKTHAPELPASTRRRLPNERQSITHKFQIGDYEGYITAGMYEDGTLGEIFLTDIGKEGSTFRGMMGAWATSISISLQYGVPIEVYARKFSNIRFEPEGKTQNPEIPTARSLVDYIMRWIVSRFGDEDLCEEFGVLTPAVKARLTARLDAQDGAPVVRDLPVVASTNGHSKHQPELVGPACNECGDMMRRAGTCYICACGNSTGCG